jgi:hypothetical protein
MFARNIIFFNVSFLKFLLLLPFIDFTRFRSPIPSRNHDLPMTQRVPGEEVALSGGVSRSRVSWSQLSSSPFVAVRLAPLRLCR